MKNMWDKIQYILTGKEKGKLFLLFVLMLFGGLMEMAGVSLVLPLIGLITNNDEPDLKRVAGLAILLIVIYIFKNIFLAIMYSAIFRFVYDGTTDLSGRMMKAYLEVDYSFHLRRNVAEIQRAICHDSETAYRMIKALLQFISECLICLILAIYLLYTDIWMSIFMFVLMGGVCGVFLKFSKKKSRYLGKEDIECRGQINKWVLQAFGGIKETKLLGREGYFYKQFLKYRNVSSKNNQKQQLLLQLPRLLVESVCISGVMCIILFEITTGKDLSVLIPKLAVFAVAAFRLLPSVGKINSLITEIMFNKPAIDAVYTELNDLSNENRAEERSRGYGIEWKDKLEVKNLSFSYSEDLPKVLSDVSFSISHGSAVGLIGPSGAGKTTLADLLMGLLKPEKGQIIVDGKNIEDNIRGWQEMIGYVPQSIYLSDDTIRANIAFALNGDEIDDDRVWKAIRQAQLEEFVKSSPDGIYTMVGDRGVRLSGGQRQRIGIARALYNDPQLLVFDEATSALDTDTEEAVMNAIESLYGEKTMIIIAHRLSTIEKCDVVYRVADTKVMKKIS